MELNPSVINNINEYYYYSSVNSKKDDRITSIKSRFIDDSFISLIVSNSRQLADTIKCLEEQIELRKLLHQNNQKRIWEQSADIGTKLLQLDPPVYGLAAEFTSPQLARRKSTLETELHSLQKEMRHQETTAWTDLSKLYMQLHHTYQDYIQASSAESFIRDGTM